MSQSNTAEVLLVDRDPSIGQEIVSSLTQRRYGVEWVDNTEKAFNCLDTRLFDVLVTELNRSQVDGMRLMGIAKNRNPEICVVMIADDPDIELATEAMRLGAYDYQTKPLNLGKLEAVIDRGLTYQQLVYQQFQLRRRLDERYSLSNVVGQSREIVNAYNQVRQAGPSTVPVILVGEAGTGKDLLAQVIHNLSERRDGPLVKLDCSEESGALMKRELFGHQRGAFPGANEAHPGRVELADGGTLFLDRAAECDAVLVEQLLHTIEHGESQRLGDARSFKTDFRTIVSVLPGLDTADSTQVLLDRLRQQHDAVVIELPPLRERRADIPVLAKYFIDQLNRESGGAVAGISRNALDLLARYEWPGNILELRNAIEGMCIGAAPGAVLDVADVPARIRRGTESEPGEVRIPPGSTMKEIERIAIEETLKRCGYNKEATAKALGIGLRTLYRKLKQYEA